MLADAGAQVVVTEQALVEPWLLQQSQSVTLVCLDDQVLAAAASTQPLCAEVGVRRRERGLCDLHLRFDGTAEGRGGNA